MESYKAWVPQEYLAQYYTTQDIAEDERAIIAFIIRFLKERNLHFSKMLEIGCGPTIHHAIPFVPHVDGLYMADYLPSNLSEIQKVLDGAMNAHDWANYVSGTLKLEGLSAPAAERIALFRSKVEKLLPCDVFQPEPIGTDMGTFPLVSTFYTLECISTNEHIWRQALSNVASLVSAEGWIILSAIYNAERYKVGEKTFPVTKVTDESIRAALIASGFIPESIETEIASCEWVDEGFDRIIVCCAQKQSIS